MKLFNKKNKNKIDESSQKTIKTKKVKQKTNKLNVLAGFMSVCILCVVIAGVIGVLMISSMLKDRPELNMSDFVTSESSKVFDRNGDLVAELGATIRENITYEQLPNYVVDAFVAVEDSRYFEHIGFDLPRFIKAMMTNIKTLSFSEGGSTFTMQLVKNTYFQSDATGTMASRSGLSGVQRKVQEIALAMELETMMSKEEIFVNYLNRLNFGSGTRNIRGIQKASIYYFNKDVTELNLSEAAYLAGVINAPNAYNAYYHPVASENRRNTVLDLMEYHGYITSDECDLAKAIPLENLLVSESTRNSRGSGNGIPYQAYIDVVVDEVYNLTGLNPYTTTMNVYTYMDPSVQGTIDEMQAGNVDGYYQYPDDYFEAASIATNVKTGEIVGIFGGRSYADGGALLLNLAVDQYKQPGSSIKPILDYVLAFENLGWATSHVLEDKPVNYIGTNIVIGNADGIYRGQVTLMDCIGHSLNTTAIQTLQQVINKVGNKYIVDYLNSIGITQATLENFNVQWGIGGSECTVSCKQMASALAMLINNGQYITPHTIKKIEFDNGKAPIEPVYTANQVISEQACYLMSTILAKNVSGDYGNLMFVLRENDYDVYGKTGTTDWGVSGRPYGIPDGAIKDGWCIAATSDYAVATWIGYTKASADTPSYMTLDFWNRCVKEKITNMILDKTVEVFGKPEAHKKTPSGISTITHIITTYPYANPLDGMDPKYITTGEIISKYANLVAPEAVTVLGIDAAGCAVPSVSGNTLTIAWPSYPDPDKMNYASEDMNLELKGPGGNVLAQATGKRLFDYSWVYGPIKYKAHITIKNAEGKVVTNTDIKNDVNTYSTSKLELGPGYTIDVGYCYGFDNNGINSNVVTKTFQIEDKDVVVNMPTSAIHSYSDLLNWAKNNNLSTAKITKEIAGEGNEQTAGTFIVKFNGEVITESSKTCKESQLSGFSAVYYEEKEITNINLTSSDGDNEILVGDTVTINVSGSSPEKVDWTVTPESSVTFSFTDNSLTFTVNNDPSLENTSITIKATASGFNEASITFTINPTPTE